MLKLNKRHFNIKVVSLVFLSLFLAGCATNRISYLNQQPKSWPIYKKQLSDIQQWNLIGRIAIKSPEESFSANIVWNKDDNNQLINIYNSLGNSYLKLSQETVDGMTTVKLNLRDHPEIVGSNIEQVMQQVTDWPLPIHLLNYWIRGLNLPRYESGKQEQTLFFNQDGQIAKQTFDLWVVEYSRYGTFQGKETSKSETMPKRLKLMYQDFSMKLSIRKWFK